MLGQQHEKAQRHLSLTARRGRKVSSSKELLHTPACLSCIYFISWRYISQQNSLCCFAHLQTDSQLHVFQLQLSPGMGYSPCSQLREPRSHWIHLLRPRTKSQQQSAVSHQHSPLVGCRSTATAALGYFQPPQWLFHASPAEGSDPPCCALHRRQRPSSRPQRSFVCAQSSRCERGAGHSRRRCSQNQRDGQGQASRSAASPVSALSSGKELGEKRPRDGQAASAAPSRSLPWTFPNGKKSCGGTDRAGSLGEIQTRY